MSFSKEPSWEELNRLSGYFPTPKFILEDGNIHLGRVHFHNELVYYPDRVQGGGCYSVDEKNKSITLHFTMCKYGAPPLELIKKAISEYRFIYHFGEFLLQRYKIYYRTGEMWTPILIYTPEGGVIN